MVNWRRDEEKVLKFGLRESKILFQLKAELAYLENLFKNGKTDNSILVKYHKKKLKFKERDSERIERRINFWITRLEEELSKKDPQLTIEEETLKKRIESAGGIWRKEGEMTSTDREKLNRIKEQLEISRKNLVRLLSWNGEIFQILKKRNF